MKTIFVALFLLFDSQSGSLLEIGAATFESREQCEAAVANVKRKVAGDMLIQVDAGCVETPLVAAK